MKVPFHRYQFGESEYEAVRAVMASGWLTTGAQAGAFERAFAEYKGGGLAISTSSCTAGLLLVMAALDLPKGAEVILPPLTFVSSANLLLQLGLVPVFADVDPETQNLSPPAAEACVTPKTRAILPVHLGGHACDMDALSDLAESRGLYLIEDCAHALETRWRGQTAGTFGMAGAFSFYATKNITSGEGGMILTEDEELDARLRRLRLHGIDADVRAREQQPGFRQYDVTVPGYKANMTDLTAALGLAQLNKVERFLARRKVIARFYCKAFQNMEGARPMLPPESSESAWHLFRLQIDPARFRKSKLKLMNEIIAAGVQLSAHFRPVNTFSYYRKSHSPERTPEALRAWKSTFSIPIYPDLSDKEAGFVAETVAQVLRESLR